MIKQKDLTQSWRQYRDVRQAPMTPNSQERLFTPSALAGMLLEEAKLDTTTAMLRACSERARHAGTSIGDLYGKASNLLSVVVEEEGQVIHAASEFLGACNGK